MKYLSIAIFAFSSLAAFAAVKKDKNPDKVVINVIRGELKTQFQIEPSSNKVTMLNNRGLKRSRDIGKENMQYLLSETGKLPTTKKLPGDCIRSKMEVISVTGKKENLKQSCFVGGSITAKQYEDIANLLAVSI